MRAQRSNGKKLGHFTEIYCKFRDYIFPGYFKSGDADMLACAKYFVQHSGSIFNIRSFPKPLCKLCFLFRKPQAQP